MKEIFRVFNDRVEVSNLGRVKKNGIIIEPCKGEHYDYITDKGKQYRIHQLVGELFPEICGEKIKWGHLHHINRNQRDNRAENLIWLTRSEHKRIHQKEEGISKAVKAYDKEGKYVGRWDSTEEAGKETKADSGHIRAILLGKTRRYTSGGLYWFKEEETESNIKEKILGIKNIKNQAFSKKVKNN